ncbi:MAG: hypothetical protein AMJ88_12230 [Anaerolineae bacterium SM23_ 63]|nr:MAG: hypothetical protein AMJ88_12230 [Anaerolineae bacterium SM23_ 63]
MAAEFKGFEQRCGNFLIKKNEPRFSAAKERTTWLDSDLPSRWRFRSCTPMVRNRYGRTAGYTLAMMLLNMFPTPLPKRASITMTANPTSRINNAYSTKPWPRGE